MAANNSSIFDDEEDDQQLMTPIIVVYLLISLLGILLNSLTIAVIKLGRTTSKESAFQILNLAVADLISAMLYPPVVLMIRLRLTFNAGSALCTILMFLDTATFYASPLWNVAISIEKFIAVFFPLLMLTYSRKQKAIVAVVVWVVACLSQFDTILYARVYTDASGPHCIIKNPLKESNLQLYDSILAVRFILPASVIVCMYGLIGVKILFRKRIGDTPWKNISIERLKVC